MAKIEYREGPEAKEEFEKAMTAIFRAPKDTPKKPSKPTEKSKNDKD